MKYIKLRSDMPDLRRGSDRAAGFDLYANLEAPVTLRIGGTANIGTGIAVEIPFGYVGKLYPRSGLGGKGLVLRNTVGIIDSDYRGEILAMVRNVGDHEIEIHPFDRFAQLVIVPVFIENASLATELSSTERGTDGFGSTGVKP